MSKLERKQELMKALSPNELLYTGKPTIKRIMAQDELLNLTNELGTVSKEVLANLTGNTGVHAFNSLVKNPTINKKTVYGVAGRRIQSAIYTNKMDIAELNHWAILSRAFWLLREKGAKIGSVSKMDDDLGAIATFNNKQIVDLQFKLITTYNAVQKPVVNDGKTLVAVFDNFELMADVLNHHSNLYTDAINNGCLVIGSHRRQDFLTVEGYMLNLIKKDDKFVPTLIKITGKDDLKHAQFELASSPLGNTLVQLEWEYSEAKLRTERGQRVKKVMNSGLKDE